LIDLSNLLELQYVDQTIRDFRKTRKDKELPLKEQEQRCLNLEGELKEKEAERLNARKLLKEKEIDLADHEDKIAKFEGQLNAASSNNEYAAILRSIAGQKADNELLEDVILELMTKIDQLKEEQNAMAGRLEEAAAETRRMQEEIARQQQEIDHEVNDLDQKRGNLSGNVDAELLEQYSRLADNLAGIAIASVKNTICTGCHMQVRPQIMNKLMGGKEIVCCAFCQRILYLPEPPS